MEISSIKEMHFRISKYLKHRSHGQTEINLSVSLEIWSQNDQELKWLMRTHNLFKRLDFKTDATPGERLQNLEVDNRGPFLLEWLILNPSVDK